jgi:UDP-N-acetyl-D-galactosamine dehydrogenase
MSDSSTRIAVVGLGYVGLPAAVAFSRKFPNTLGFDTDEEKIELLKQGHDPTGDLEPGALAKSGLRVTSDPEDLETANFYVVAVPTPIDEHKRPDLRILGAATETVGGSLKKGDIVVYESTVYPGVTEEFCGPILERASGLRCGIDFKLGYSPERINPGDHEHTFENVIKVVSGQDPETLDRVATIYGSLISAGVHRASSIRVAEACKVIENVQRDLNIALMNELSIIFDRVGIRTTEVLEAAGTKWNFLKFHPGLVGGHCIGVDPYYLTALAECVGLHPQVILAGRRINDGMGRHVAQQTIKELSLAGLPPAKAKVAILGIAFKENVPDARNSRVPDIKGELESFGVEVVVHDPLVPPEVAREEYDLELVPVAALSGVDAVILAVPHEGLAELAERITADGAKVVVDVRSTLSPDRLPEHARYWAL